MAIEGRQNPGPPTAHGDAIADVVLLATLRRDLIAVIRPISEASTKLRGIQKHTGARPMQTLARKIQRHAISKITRYATPIEKQDCAKILRWCKVHQLMRPFARH